MQIRRASVGQARILVSVDDETCRVFPATSGTPKHLEEFVWLQLMKERAVVVSRFSDEDGSDREIDAGG